MIARTAGRPVLALVVGRRSAVPRPEGSDRFPELGGPRGVGADRVERRRGPRALARAGGLGDARGTRERARRRRPAGRCFVRALKGRQTGTGAVAAPLVSGPRDVRGIARLTRPTRAILRSRIIGPPWPTPSSGSRRAPTSARPTASTTTPATPEWNRDVFGKCNNPYGARAHVRARGHGRGAGRPGDGLGDRLRRT